MWAVQNKSREGICRRGSLYLLRDVKDETMVYEQVVSEMKEWEDQKTKLVASIHSASTLDELEDIRITALGKKGTITGLMKSLGSLDPDKRKEAGQLLNAIKEEVASAIDVRKVTMEDAALETQLHRDRLDHTLPVRPESNGSIHPITQTIDELTAIFCEMGFTVADGPHIESDYYNFSALNIPCLLYTSPSPRDQA